MGVIKTMDHRLANMIAAGEVVERSASVVKELVENAIDAKANRIDIHIYDLGLSKIVVSDNGIGMDKEDAKNAFMRHATSKLFSSNDLNHIQTLGFRGEALAAIASVSKVLLKTRQENQEGHYVVFKDGHFVESGTATLNEGTVIEVSSLFYNTPARFKYLKSEATERMHLIEMFDQLALSSPNIAFSLYFDEKLFKKTSGNQQMHHLIEEVIGTAITKRMTHVVDQFLRTKIELFLISPEFTKANRKHIYIFINGRMIKNYPIQQAIIEGYHSLLMTNRYPIVLLYLEMDPVLLDVNVHPRKLEIKLSNEQLLTYHLKKLIHQALNQRENVIPENIGYIHKDHPHENIVIEESYQRQTFDFITDPNDVDVPTKKDKRIPDFDYIGSLFGTYLLFQNQEGLFLVDQHAAQERIRYEYYFKTFSQPLKQSQQRIISHPLSLTSNDLLQVNSYIHVFNEHGFEFNHQLELVATPTWLKDSEIDLCIEKMIHMLEKNNRIDLALLRDQLAKDVSCKGAIKANHALSMSEINQLMFDLRQTENPYSCPHGRPTIIKISIYDIEKMFRRIV